MAYFIFNPQTNELEDSDNPTPIRQNLGQKFLASGGLARMNFDKGTPINRDVWRDIKVDIGDKNYKALLKKLYDENADYSIIQRLRKKYKNKAVSIEMLMDMGEQDRSNFKDLVKKVLHEEKQIANFKKEGYLTADEFSKKVGLEPRIQKHKKGHSFKIYPFTKYLSKDVGTADYGAGDIYDSLKPKKIGNKWYLKTPSEDQIKKLQDFHYGDSWRRGLRSFTVKKIQNIAKNKAFMEKLKAGTENALSDNMIKKIFGPESKTGPYVIMQLGRALNGEVDVPGVEKDAKLGNAIIKAIAYKANHEPGFGKWHKQAYLYAESQLEKALRLKKGEQGFREGRRKVSKLFKELGLKDFNIDEIHSMSQGLKNKTNIYSVFSQAIEGRINQNEKRDFDNQSSRRQKRLTTALKSGNLKKARELITEQDDAIAQFYKDNPGTKGKVKLSTFDLRDPEAVFGKKRWASLHPNVKRAMLESFEKVNLTIDPGKGALTQKEWKDVLNKKIKNKAIKDTALKVLSYGLSLPIVALNQAAGAPIKDIPISEKIPLIGGGDFPMTAKGQVEDITSITDMLSQWDKNRKEKEYYTQVLAEEGTGEVPAYDFAAGGPVIPRVEYRAGTLGDARGWEKMLDKDNPETMAKLEALKVLQDQKTAEYRNQAHENRFLHRSDDYYTSQEESFIPHYVQDVAKTTFGTDAGRKYFGSKLAEGAIEGTEWLVMQIPHLMSKVNPVGLMKLQKEMEEGNFSWMDLLYEPKLGEKWGMNAYQQRKLEELREQAIAEGKPGIPQGVETLGTTGELGAMFADPFVAYGAYRKLAPHLKTKKRGIEEQVDEGRRDTLKTLGTGGLMVALAKIFPGIFKDTKALKAAGATKKVGQTVKQFGNVRGMPDWFPSFMLKATQKGKLKSLPDRDYIEPMVYELMLPVKIRLGKGKIQTKEVPVTVTQNPRDGTMTVDWTGTDNYGDEIKRSITYEPGQTGTQNYAADEYGRGVSKEEVVIQDPEFNYTEPDYSSMGFEDTSPDSASFLDIHDEADEIVEAMEEFVKGTDDKFKKKAADEFRLYNQTDEHLGDASGHQTSDGDWVGHEDNRPFPDYDKEVKDVYKPGWNRKKKAMGGVASGPPPLSGPVPQGLPSLQPGDIYNEWIK